MNKIKKIGFAMLLAALAMGVAGCHCNEKKACCGTCGGDKKAVEEPVAKPEHPAEKPAGEKPLDHPAH